METSFQMDNDTDYMYDHIQNLESTWIVLAEAAEAYAANEISLQAARDRLRDAVDADWPAFEEMGITPADVDDADFSAMIQYEAQV